MEGWEAELSLLDGVLSSLYLRLLCFQIIQHEQQLGGNVQTCGGNGEEIHKVRLVLSSPAESTVV